MRVKIVGRTEVIPKQDVSGGIVDALRVALMKGIWVYNTSIKGIKSQTMNKEEVNDSEPARGEATMGIGQETRRQS